MLKMIVVVVEHVEVKMSQLETYSYEESHHILK
jgi:hypothetical protein